MSMDWLCCGLLSALFISSFTDGSQVFNCTFQKEKYTFVIKDDCGFTNSPADDFSWSFTNMDTVTSNTGPTQDHTGKRFGYYAYIESSMKTSGQYARLTSPTFSKPSGDAGGCVQLYYHMYGADIGTLNISVYDNTQSGLVANFQRTGEQGNQWLRADINLNLPANPSLELQLILDASVSGPTSVNNRGDIAVDDITITTSGQCTDNSQTPPTTQPTAANPGSRSTSAVAPGSTSKPNWRCDFEGFLNRECGMSKLNYGARFSTGSKSFSKTTGPQADRTTGNGHFLWMQGLGAQENSSAVVETPRFDKPYNCFTFWYHMFGDGVGELRVDGEVTDGTQYLWSQRGNKGNNWKQGRVRIIAGAIKLIITAIRGSTADSDIAIDDLELSTTDCDGLTVPIITTPAPTRPPTTGIQPTIQLGCNFDSDECSFYQDTSGDFNWKRMNGPTYTSGTGPSADHTQGDFSGHYMYLPSNYKVNGTKARIQSGLISVTPGQSACLRLSYHMYGADMGTLNIRVKTLSGSVVTSVSLSGDQGNSWNQTSIDISYSSTQVYLEFEGTIEHSGGPLSRVAGEMAIDDIILTEWSACSDLDMIRVNSQVTVASTTQSTVTPPSTTAPPSTRPPPTTTPWTTQTTTPPAIVTCSFDNNGLCGFTQSRADDIDWKRYNNKYTSADTGPSSDHTHGTSSGYFLIIDASYKRSGYQAVLTSPAYTALSNTGCLTFWYHMWGADMGTLKISIIKSGQITDLYAISENQGNQWRQFSIRLDLSNGNHFQIRFTGIVSHRNGDYAEVLGDIAIDDVSVDRLSSSCAVNTPSTPRTTAPPSTTTQPTTTTTVRNTTPTGGVGQVKNCTFSRYVFNYVIPDFLYCGFTQSFTDNFQWNIASSATNTAGTGPIADHTGAPGGHFAYIESSYKNRGQYARLTSPTFSKPSGDAGGCVQLYYHMYGADIGTLNISVYDNTQSGLVANFQRTGEQGNVWLRASLNLNLPSAPSLNLQLVIDAHVGSGDRGDIAIDDIIINTRGQCSQGSDPALPRPPTTSSIAAPTATTPKHNWKCNFEGLNKYCGTTRLSYGASFSVSTNSLRVTTGPQADHTTGNGHFLWMQGMGAQENSSAVVETPRFDQSYNCFTFWYHMFGGGVRELKVEADVNGLNQFLWSQTGNKGDNWKQGRVRIMAGAIKLIITAIRGSTADSDIAIDDLELSTTDCDGLTVPIITTPAPTRPPTTGIQPTVQLGCNFDSDECSFYQDTSDDFNWKRMNGPTYTPGTGPTADHTQGDFSGYYMYLPSNYKVNGTKARIQSGLISVTAGQSACLRFSYHMYGADMGTLNIRVKTLSGSVVKSVSLSGDQGNSWNQTSIDISYSSSQVYLEFEGTIEHSGGPLSRVTGEMAIDDIILTRQSSCSDLDLIRVVSAVTVPTTTNTLSTVTTPAPPSTPPPPTTTPTTTHTTEPPVVQSCGFDGVYGLCGYQPSADGDFNWSRYNAKASSGDTGPSADHTFGNMTYGYFMLVDATYKNDGDKATLVTPSYTALATTGCLTFWYHMWGASMGTLKVSMSKAGEVSDLISISGNQGNLWKRFSLALDLQGTNTFQIFFTGIISHQNGSFKDVLGDIALDDVSVDRMNVCGASPTTAATSQGSAKSSPTKNSPTANSTSATTNATACGNCTTRDVAAPSAQKDVNAANPGVVAGVVVSVVVIMIAAVLVSLVIMRRRQLWLFAPGTKMSVMFSKPGYDTYDIYNGHSDLYTTDNEPSLVINGNGVYKRGDSTEA